MASESRPKAAPQRHRARMVTRYRTRIAPPSIVMPGIAHTSTRSRNWALVYHLLDGWFSQPVPVYIG
jgi:hypothetical protein